MASFRGLSAAMITIMFFTVVAATEYTVGGLQGWRSPVYEDEAHMYQLWVDIYKFQVGDSLSFEYRNDSVIRVEKRGYHHCNQRSPPTDGTTVFLLDKPGFYYFVSGDVDHCKKGQKMKIDVPPQPSQPGAGTSPPS